MSTIELSLPGIDFTALLAPISETSPAGIDLRQLPRSVYLEIESLIEGRGVPDVIVADANGRQSSTRDERALSHSITDGLKRALGSLARESKDLEIVALSAQALLSLHGYEGLWGGLRLMRELHEQFWESLYPKPRAAVQTLDEFDEPLAEPITEPPHWTERRVLSARADAVEKMAHALRGAVKLAALFIGDDGLPCRLADWESAKSPDPDRTTEQLNSLASSQPAVVFATLEQILGQCITECLQLGEVLEQKYTRPAVAELDVPAFTPPSMASLGNELRDCLSFVTELRKRLGKDPVRATKPGPTNLQDAGSSRRLVTASADLHGGRFQPKDRAEALGMLLAAGQFLQRHEPLSPLPRSLFRLVLWARSESLRPWLDDMFRASESEPETVFLRLGLDAESKLASERLPSGCPSPKDRSEALGMLTDVAAKLLDHEPLSPLPYHLHQLLALAAGDSPKKWLAQVFAADSPTLARIHRLLGLTPQADSPGPDPAS